MKSTMIQLDAPLPWFDKRLDRLLVKEPSGALYLDLGEPRFFVRAADGSVYAVEREDVVAKYLDRLVTLPDGAPIDGGVSSLMRFLPLTDVMRLKQALLDFFTDASSATSREKPGSSSSAPASSPPTSPMA
ncbi:hypothetical protein [Methylocella sp.]|uniref:hypothetical protein n=1 Tax=Methylocella sp. TaxID=1978226 RepID=UPI0037835079